MNTLQNIIYSFSLIFLFTLTSCFQKKKETTLTVEEKVQQKLDSFASFKIIDITSNKRYFLHQSGRGNSILPCQIDKSSIQNYTTTGAVTILCWLDAQELDLSLSGLKFKLELPSGICERLKVEPYWFWNFKVGNSSLSYTTYSNAEKCDSCNGGTCESESAPKGTYDYSITAGLPNCDVGNIFNVNYKMDPGGPECTSGNPTTTYVSAGGKLKECISGPGINFTTGPLGAQEIPTSKIYETSAGLEEEFDFTHPSATKGDTYIPAVYYSNYIHQCKSNTNAYNYDIQDVLNYVTNTGGLTNSVADPLKSYGHLALSPNPFYTFACMDHAYEYKAIIHIQVRAWDRKFGVGDNLDQTKPALYSDLSNEPGETNGSLDDIGDWTSLGTSTNIDCTNDPTSSGFEFPQLLYSSASQ